MTFARCFRRQTRRQDAVGDLARDRQDDSCWPHADTLAEYQEHIAVAQAEWRAIGLR